MDHEKIHLEPGETCPCRKRRKLFAKPLDFSEKRSIVKLSVRENRLSKHHVPGSSGIATLNDDFFMS